LAEPDLFERLSGAWLGRDDVTSGQMFGWVGLKAGRRFFALSIEDRLIVKLPLEEVAALIFEGTGRQFDPGWGRTKKLWIDVGPSQADVWEPLMERAYEHVRSLDQ